jgi:hypothetical protein
VTAARRLLVIAVGTAVAVAAGCQHAGRADSSELALAAAASESVTVALADSLSGAIRFARLSPSRGQP